MQKKTYLKKGGFMKKLVFILLIMGFTFSNIQAQSKSFKIFNSIKYNNTPSLSEYGLLPISIPLASDSMITPNSPYNIIDSKIIAYAISHRNSDIVGLDIESWSYALSDIGSTTKKYISVLDTFRAYNSKSKLGYYNVPNRPEYYWDKINTPTKYSNWQALNDSLSNLYNAVDFFSPSFYCYNNDSSSWRKFVQANINEIKRKDPKHKPIYGYIWPQYHDKSPLDSSLSLKFIDTTFWSFQLETLYKMTDGIIIWTSNKDAAGNTISWNNSMPWWITTQNFIKKHNLGSLTLNLTAAIQGYLNTTTNRMNMTDKIKVILRANVAPAYAALDSATVNLDSASLSSIVTFHPASTAASYYIVVKHRNSVETWSVPATFTGSSLSYNFTDVATKAYGSNLIQKGTKFCIYGADVNQDRFVDLKDASPIQNAINNFLMGYLLPTDTNGDHFVDLKDSSVEFNNQSNYVHAQCPICN
jgi:hypothetical protein